MANNIENRSGLKFFGRVSASVSHDIKNVLAIINEEAGLIQDLCRMAEKGMEIQPERFMQVAGNILGQIRRGDEIVKSMNTFAHSVDQDVRLVDIAALLGLMVRLSARLAGMKSVNLTLGNCQDAEIKTDAYGLQHLLFNLILSCLDNMGTVRELSLYCNKTPDGSVVVLSGAERAKEALTEEIKELAAPLGAGLEADDTEHEIKVVLPREIGA